MIVDATQEGGTWLRLSLMDGAELVGRGRGLLMGNCPAGSRTLSIDGYEGSACTLVDDEEFLSRLGLAGMGLVELPHQEERP